MCREKEMCDKKKVCDQDCIYREFGWWLDNKKKYFKRNHYIHVKDEEAFLKDKNEGIFKTIYRYSQTDIQNSLFIGDFYLDFDCKGDFEKVREDALTALAYISVVFKIESSSLYIYFSGSKGIHITIPYEYFNIEPSNNLNMIYRYIAENISNYTKNKTIDLQIYDNKRLFRIPNTVHEKSKLYKIQLNEEELRNVDYCDIIKMASNKRTLNVIEHTDKLFSTARYNDLCLSFKESLISKKKLDNIRHKQTLKITPPCIKAILSEGVSDGNRNNSTAIIASFYKNRGLEMNKALELLLSWNAEKNNPPSLESEIVRTTRSIFFGNYNYGCSSIKTITECFEEKCPIKKGKKDERK